MNLTESSSAATPDLIAQAIPGMAFWHLDLAKDHVYWSPALKSLYGVDEAPATLADYLSMIHSENRARAAELVADWLARHQSFEHVFTLSRPDGERRNIRETGSVQRDREGHALSIIGVNFDITNTEDQTSSDRLQLAMPALERRFAESTERLKLFIDDAPVAMAMFDSQMCYIAASRLWSKQFLNNSTEIAGRNHYIISREVPKRWRDYHQRGLAGETIDVKEDSWEAPDGHTIWQSYRVQPWHVSDGSVGGIIILATDLTARKLAELDLATSRAELAEKNSLLETLFTAAPLGLAFVDSDLRFVRVNAALAEMNGASVAAHVGSLVSDMVPDLKQGAETSFRTILETGKPLRDVILSGTTKAQPGVVREWREQFYPVHSENGAVAGIGIIAEEVTERRAIEKALRASENRVRRVLDQLFAFVGTLDISGILMDVNTAPLIAADLSRDDVIGKPFSDAGWWSNDAKVQAQLNSAISKAASGEIVRYDVTICIRNKEEVTIDFQLSPMYDDEGVITNLIASGVIIEERVQAEQSLRKLTEELENRVTERTAQLVATNEELAAEIHRREQAQAALLQAQKLEAIGQLTAGIAHDFNNVIAAIAGGFEIISRRTNEEKILSIARHGISAAERGAGLIRQMLAFARQQPLETRAVDLAALLTEAEPLIRRSLDPATQLTITCPANIGMVQIDPALLEAALINLSVNARDAMPADGRFSITVAHADKAAADYPAEFQDQNAIALTITDTGSGMPPEVLSRVMEPFFTTKGPGKGTGLGLAMVHGFIMQSGGAMRIASAPGQGTTISLYLHPAAPPHAASGPAALDAHSKKPSLTILVVDDDPAVRALVAAQLEELGHQVLTADGAAEALTLLETAQATPTKVQLVISDVMMPITDGCKLAQQVRDRWPNLPVMFMTGQSEDPRLKGEQVIAKPFNLAALTIALQEADTALT